MAPHERLPCMVPPLVATGSPVGFLVVGWWVLGRCGRVSLRRRLVKRDRVVSC
ncbi:MAG: hypothetical protein ACHBN1_04565 [Heteroscytonema crispum UTEX LB 1556]